MLSESSFEMYADGLKRAKRVVVTKGKQRQRQKYVLCS